MLNFFLTRGRTASHLGLPNPSSAKKVYFGMNVLAERRGLIRVGDEMEVIRVLKQTQGEKDKKSSAPGLKAD